MNHRPFGKRIVNLFGRYALAVVLRISRRLTPEGIDKWGERLGRFICCASMRYRKVAIKNLTLSFPEWSKERVREVCLETFVSFSKTLLEFFYFAHRPDSEIDNRVKIEGKEHIDRALEEGKGAIIITAHFGNWELFARKLVRLGYKLSVIARDSDDQTMTDMINGIRSDGGYRALSRQKSAIPAIRCLKRNELLGILPDQNTHSGIFVDFFGRPAATPNGPAVFSLKTGSPIICGFARRVDTGHNAAASRCPTDRRER